MYNFIYFPILCFLALVTAEWVCQAPESKDSSYAVWAAVFTEGGLYGAVVFWSLEGYVSCGLGLKGLPARGGPFEYHIHTTPVPKSGNCDATMGHFNPYCGTADGRIPSEKEVGDLSGKHGKLSGTDVSQYYDDHFLSINPKDRAFIGNLPIVLHLASGRRFACANLVKVLGKPTGAQAEAFKQLKGENLPKEVRETLGLE
ncbi:hypothetical protein OXX80_002578 [Metschnikowia pulcherrima]